MKIILLAIFAIAINAVAAQEDAAKSEHELKINSKPYARYWWFASMIQEDDVKYNLDWLKEHGFGGVELAWVYPLNRFNPEDTSYTPRQEWLSPEWQDIVEFAAMYAESIGLGCDMTFGTLWPFGDTKTSFEQATQRYGEPDWRQQIRLSWEHPKVGYVIDHLTPEHYLPYFDRLLNAFPRPKTQFTNSYFIDSWEVETEKLWCKDFDKDFQKKFNYDITPYMNEIYEPKNSEYLYDYMKLISEKVLRFYRDFDSTLNSVGIMSRGQVSGAPCDLISGYALMDIPEGESMLFEPEFCAIPSSATLLSGKSITSSETFTCIYGWPRDYIRKEQTADLKLVADALFANGINHIIWHGKAHNPKDVDTVNFYATTHIGDDGMLADEIKDFNKYLETVQSYMRKGTTYSDVAVYLPTEDAWKAGIMPKDMQFKWAWGFYEMRYVYFPEELDGYNPVWINHEFLSKAYVKDGLLHVGNEQFKFLYVDVNYLEYDTKALIQKFSWDGLNVIMKKVTEQPGFEKLIDVISGQQIPDFDQFFFKEMPDFLIPFITGKKIPRHWCRKDDGTLYIFFANPKADRIKFPMEYGQSFETETETLPVKINYDGSDYEIELVFRPYQSLLYKIEDGKIENIDIQFRPSTPEIIYRPPNYEAPWLVK
ncbi:MAG: hypothetical protein M9949_01425 [Candidatus Kapabacteria bacterium]|nr:hypothetical protein [Candidatus Kapabacteria bacterium]